MLIGYARTSTTQQCNGFEAQLAELEKAGCEKIFREQVSAVQEREQLNAAIDFVREGDTFVATKLDRLARSVSHLLQIVEMLNKKGVTLRILNIGLDTSNPTGKLMLTTLGAIAEWERSMMLERQKDGIAAAKEQGKYKGRKPTARAKADQVLSLVEQGLTREAISERLDIGVASVYRILAGAKQNQ
jgi:DNA invertase Pin-like site-specific DNA recombinase